jgi:hypothetical protein
MQPEREDSNGQTLVCLLFGTAEANVGWTTAQELSSAPTIGMLTNIKVELRGEDGAETDGLNIPAVIAWIEEADDGDLVYLYGGPALPDEEDLAILDAGDWERLEADTASRAIEVIDGAPPAAAFHNVILVIGDPSDLDEEGKPHFDVWNRPLIPDDPFLPVYGERLPIDLFDCTDYEYEGPDDADEDGDDDFDEDVDDEDELNLELDLDEEPPVFPDPWEGGNPSDGYPALVIYTALTGLGEASIAFWIPRLDGADGFDLTAAGWEKLNEETFDFGVFRASERIDLAMRTHLVTLQDEEGFWYLSEAVIDDAESVSEDQYELLPPAIADQCRFASELTSLENIVETWRDDDPPQA